MHEGDFWKGMAHGKAKVIMPNGAELKGDFVDGVMHGRLVGHYDKELHEERNEKGEITDEDAEAWKTVADVIAYVDGKVVAESPMAAQGDLLATEGGEG